MDGRKRRMTWMDRLTIEKLYNSGSSYRSIARAVGFAVSSVHAEVQRGLYPHMGAECSRRPLRYSAQIAEDDAAWCATSRGGSIKLGSNHTYATTISKRILAGESPDQIVGSLRRSGQWTVSTVTLYRYIDQGYIPGVTNKNLWIKRKKVKRSYRKVKAARPPQGVSIERRPEQVNSRTTFGHWEMDTVIGKAKGKNQVLLVLSERLTRYELVVKLTDRLSSSVVRALSKLVSSYPPQTFQSITVDNGSEFSDCYGIEALVSSLYYCHPYSSYERGTNENSNRLIRRFYPKGQSLEHVNQRDCDGVARYMNRMHRKILDYATPAELFHAHVAML